MNLLMDKRDRAAVAVAVWWAHYREPVSNTKLAQILGVSKTTLIGWAHEEMTRLEGSRIEAAPARIVIHRKESPPYVQEGPGLKPTERWLNQFEGWVGGMLEGLRREPGVGGPDCIDQSM